LRGCELLTAALSNVGFGGGRNHRSGDFSYHLANRDTFTTAHRGTFLHESGLLLLISEGGIAVSSWRNTPSTIGMLGDFVDSTGSELGDTLGLKNVYLPDFSPRSE
jgi:hypothetical protein